MRHPRLILVEPDHRLDVLLAELAGETRWVVHSPKRRTRTSREHDAENKPDFDTALSLAREARPAVLVVEVEPGTDDPAAFALIADVHHHAPDVAVVAVSDAKLPDADRAMWTAVLLDLGARYVLFPPVTRSVLEDVVSGLMAAAVRRVMGDAPSKPAAAEAVIDLADEEPHG